MHLIFSYKPSNPKIERQFYRAVQRQEDVLLGPLPRTSKQKLDLQGTISLRIFSKFCQKFAQKFVPVIRSFHLASESGLNS